MDRTRDHNIRNKTKGIMNKRDEEGAVCLRYFLHLLNLFFVFLKE